MENTALQEELDWYSDLLQPSKYKVIRSMAVALYVPWKWDHMGVSDGIVISHTHELSDALEADVTL